MNVNALDLSAGSGGVSLGLHLIGLTDLGFEISNDECATRDAAGFLTVRADLSQLDPTEFVGAEGLWDSSPCPDFSVAGKGAGRTGKSGWLVDEKMRWIKACKPKWIACENVPGVLPIFREQCLELATMGYSTWAGCISSEEFGVPQTRDRAYLMAHFDHPVAPPQSTHQSYVFGVPAQEVTTIFGTLRPWVSMAEALTWGMTERPALTLPTAGGTRGGMGDGMGDGMGGSGARATLHAEKDRGAWSVNTGRDWKKGGTREDAQTIPFTEPAPAPALTAIAGPQWQLQPGKFATMVNGNRRLYGGDDPSPTLAFGHDAAQWCWVRPATTIAAGSRSEDAIKLTPPEALALMGMPVDYPLQGSRTAAFRQIGNGVCPPVAAAIVGELVGADWRAALDEVRGGR